MFNNTQIESYQNITAPADLKKRVLVACQSTKEVKAFAPAKNMYHLATLAACLVLCFTLFLPSFQKEREAFYLLCGEKTVDAYNMQLPPLPQDTNAMVRTISMEPTLYTICLQTTPDVDIVCADGDATLDESGNLAWTVMVPEDNAVFTLTLQAGDDTYEVSLTYHSQDGSFSISCQAN